MVVGAEFGTGQVFWSMLWFFLFLTWFWLVISVFGGILRDRSMSGWSKALWTLAVIAVPILGVLVYLAVKGDNTSQRYDDYAITGYSSAGYGRPIGR
jgi:uncharacterized membrane protein YhaH (DUF805 family)